MIKWGTDLEESRLEAKIAKRAVELAEQHGIEYKQMDAVMDIDACHNNGCPLDLERLFNADDFNFVHDVFGIRKNINRKTGQLENCFFPRYAKKQEEGTNE